MGEPDSDWVIVTVAVAVDVAVDDSVGVFVLVEDRELVSDTLFVSVDVLVVDFDDVRLAAVLPEGEPVTKLENASTLPGVLVLVADAVVFNVVDCVAVTVALDVPVRVPVPVAVTVRDLVAVTVAVVEVVLLPVAVPVTVNDPEEVFENDCDSVPVADSEVDAVTDTVGDGDMVQSTSCVGTSPPVNGFPHNRSVPAVTFPENTGTLPVSWLFLRSRYLQWIQSDIERDPHSSSTQASRRLRSLQRRTQAAEGMSTRVVWYPSARCLTNLAVCNVCAKLEGMGGQQGTRTQCIVETRAHQQTTYSRLLRFVISPGIDPPSELSCNPRYLHSATAHIHRTVSMHHHGQLGPGPRHELLHLHQTSQRTEACRDCPRQQVVREPDVSAPTPHILSGRSKTARLSVFAEKVLPTRTAS